MSNKPNNVVRHEHFSVHTPEEIDADESLDVNRYDACLLADGTAGVWDVANDEWLPTRDFNTAQQAAAWCRDFDSVWESAVKHNTAN